MRACEGQGQAVPGLPARRVNDPEIIDAYPSPSARACVPHLKT